MLIVMFLTVGLFAEDKIYPLDIRVKVHPEVIRYGDPCFVTYSISNKGQETLFVPYGKSFLFRDSSGLYYGERKILSWYQSNLKKDEGLPLVSSVIVTFPRFPIKPGETMEFLIRMIWLPQPEFTHNEQAKEFLQLVKSGNKDYKFRIDKFYSVYQGAYSGPMKRLMLQSRYNTTDGRLQGEDVPLTFKELCAKGYRIDILADDPICSIRVLPRSEIELKLLQEWYLEFPAIADWTMGFVFAHPYYANGSPYKKEASTPHELWKKREPFGKAFSEFATSIETRTPESLARIRRTNELAAKILERAKQPGSTISQNMVEFIQLRSFLVDMRYAENLETEKVAFDNLIEFIENTNDKELWLKFLDEIALDSIVNYTHFKPEKVQHYRKQFAEHFAEDFKKIGWTVRP
jgi:hypothetical protein